jgi:hypothetical protein
VKEMGIPLDLAIVKGKCFLHMPCKRVCLSLLMISSEQTREDLLRNGINLSLGLIFCV